ncbi:unnamed protein product [Rotaria sordida]|uniref:Uncharacterized protein n=1 Tax=Rotaria sordida TaxID=392033 RepID=A0A819VBE5_9BILA|nr:unnamed protein product [Rotaria sordida]CAF4106725.1 unnamed protein product [Rotaria sordida]
MTYKEYVDKYLVSLDSFTRYLKIFYKQQQQQQKREQLFWISPYPFKTNMSHEETSEFERVNKEIDKIMQLNMYQKYDRFDLFVRRQDLVITRISHFSLHGVREINDSIARTVGQQMNRSFTPAIPFPSTPLTKQEQRQNGNITGIGNTIITSNVSATITTNDTIADDDNNDEH